MMLAGTELQVLVATRPVDFRKQADTMAAFVQEALAADPFSGALYVFRAKRGRQSEAVMVVRNWHLPAGKAARRQHIPLATGRGRRDAAHAWATRRTARRDRLGAG
jgi:transposase